MTLEESPVLRGVYRSDPGQSARMMFARRRPGIAAALRRTELWGTIYLPWQGAHL